MNKSNNYNDLLHLVYEAALDDSLWPVVLNQFTTWLGSPSGHLSILRPQAPELSVVYEDMINPEFGPLYEARIIEDPWYRGAEGLKSGDIFIDQELCLSRLYKQSDYYREVAAPYGIERCAGGVVYRNAEANVVITGNGPGGFKGFDQRSKAMVQRVLPHLNRAYRSSLHISQLNSKIASLKRGLDGFTSPIALLDTRGLLCYMNEQFEQVVEREAMVSVSRGKLMLELSQEQKALEQLLAQAAAAQEEPDKVLDLGLRVTLGANHSRYNLLVLALRSASGLSGLPSQAAVMLILTDYNHQSLPSIELIETLYGLSRNQARLTKCLLSDMSLADAAEVLGITVQTARSYLKEILAKTDTHSQKSLILKLSRLFY